MYDNTLLKQQYTAQSPNKDDDQTVTAANLSARAIQQWGHPRRVGSVTDSVPNRSSVHHGDIASCTINPDVGSQNQLNVEARISLTRRTLYSLINTRVHGSNELNRKVSFKIYQCYVLPRLLYGLKNLQLSKTHLDMLNKLHMTNLRNFQSLPCRTTRGTTFLLIGALPLEAEIRRRQRSFLHNILACNNTTLQDLAERQLVIYIDNPLSFFCITSQLLHQYELPDSTP